MGTYKDEKENRKKLANMLFCMTYLHIKGMLTDTEEHKVYERIRKFQDKFEIGITEKQLDSVYTIYKD